MTGYLVRHWRGELSLAVTVWVNCAGLTLLLFFGIPWLAGLFNWRPAESASGYAQTLAIQAVTAGLVPLWQFVGLWRAADRRAASDAPLAGRVAQSAAVLFTLFIAMRVLLDGSQAIIASRVAFSLGSYRHTVELLPGRREIEVTGGLGLGTTGEVAALLARNPQVRRIRLNSGGGALSEGVSLRHLIESHALDTYTSTGCSSACVSAFMGGRFRYLQRGARIGLHLPRNWEPLSISPVARAYVDEIAYFQKRGVPPWFLRRWIGTGQAMWYPSVRQLRRAGIVNVVR